MLNNYLLISKVTTFLRKVSQKNTILLLLLLLTFHLFSTRILNAQDLVWRIFDEFGTNINNMAIEDSILWINAGYSLVKFNLSNTDTTVYKMKDGIDAIRIDRIGNKWLGFWGKMAKFDDSLFTYYNLTEDHGFETFGGVNSIAFDKFNHLWFGVDSGGVGTYNWNSWDLVNQLEYTPVTDIEVDKNDIKWVGTTHGIEKYDNINWFHYDESNSGLPDNFITAVAVDSFNNKLFGTYHGFVIYDDTTWTLYNTSNSDLTDNGIYYIYVASDGTIWLGLRTGNLVAIKGDTWIVYNPPSGHGEINSIVEDNSDNIWFTTSNGFMISSSDITVDIQELNKPATLNKYILYQNYPNPFNPNTNLTYFIPSSAYVILRIYDILGQEIRTLVNSKKYSGQHSVVWNGTDNRCVPVTSGIYLYIMSVENNFQSGKMILMK